ncbi:hypothetical protein B0H65DRAFT_56867 [Neurospora tetraspora]|uniref:Uncharacterized protein n=1 Tax=Neurospora tetraspora TaxID=94610 RepID=A0AAE0JQ84_9PEZI|nr:hypothetical protein B0H65DRAFT_56867 [Neurospora tetraspora]
MFMLYHVQQRMWLCDFDEFGLAEDTQKEEEQSASISPIMSKLVYYHFYHHHHYILSYLPLHLFLSLIIIPDWILPNQLLSLLSLYLTTSLISLSIYLPLLTSFQLTTFSPPFPLSIYPSSYVKFLIMVDLFSV